MAYSTFQSVTGPTGPEGVKAPGIIGVDGNIGPSGITGPNSPHLTEYEYPYNDVNGNNYGKVKLTFSDSSSVIIDAVTGPNAFPVTEQDRPTSETFTVGLGSYIGLTAAAENLGSSGRIFVSQSDGPGTGTTFELRGLTATDDLQLYVTDTQIFIGGTGGATSGYVDHGKTGEFLHLDPRWKAQGGNGTFFGASADNTGTGDSIKLKFRNVVDEVTDEFDAAFCNKEIIVGGGGTAIDDRPREYILDVSSLIRYNEGGVTFGNLCISVSTENIPDRVVILRTKHPNDAVTEKLRYPLWGASSINFADPLNGDVSFSDQGYGNEEIRRGITGYNTPYDNEDEGYIAGVHPLTWNVSESGDAIPCPTEEAIIYDTGCKSNDEFIGEEFRGKPFCTAGPLVFGGYTAASYCLQVTEDMFESQNTLDPWYGKIRMVVMPACESFGIDQTALRMRIDCRTLCSCSHSETQCCVAGDCGSAVQSTETVTGRINLDITDNNFFQVKAPFQIAGITWSYDQRPGLSLSSDDGIDYAEMKNITLVVEDGPNNIAFPDNVFFAGTPKFTSGIDIVNLASIDNGETWFATLTGYGWDVDVFRSSTLGSCCTNLNCQDFVDQSYCDSIGGLFEQDVACANRTDDVCGAGEQGACCSGVGDYSVEYVCEDDETNEPGGECYCADNPSDTDYCFGALDCPDGYCGYLCMGGPCSSRSRSQYCCANAPTPGDCGTCTQEVGSCCVTVGENSYCFETTDGCQRDGCEQMGQPGSPFITSWKIGLCADRRSDPFDPCGQADNKCCQDCASGGECIPHTGPGDPLGICTGGVVDDCSQCENLTAVTVARPVCLTPATALSCNLINGYFVPEDSVLPPQTPCDVCNSLDACSPFVFGTCCNEFSGQCYGTGKTEVQCAAFPNSKWTPEVEDCDICCPQKEYRGACCLCNDQCIDQITPQQCGTLRGTFMGDESQCDNVNCSVAGPCDDCVCEGLGCCNCETGQGRSPCCDNPNDPSCCDPDDDCCDPNVECGCNTGVPCCNDGSPPGPDGCDGDPPGPPKRPENDRDGFDFAGFGGFGGNGGGAGGGGIDPRSEWIKGSCCMFGGQCNDGQFMVSRDDENFDPNKRAQELCKGTFSTDPCFMSKCPKTKFIGSCCCAYWTLFCPSNEQYGGNAADCETCIVDDIKITCTDCSFDGNIPSFGRPWDGRSGPDKPVPGVYDPNDTPPRPGNPYVTPNGLELPYRWQDCCKNPGGCAAKPCPVEDREALEELGVYYHKERDCGGDPPYGFPEACPTNLSTFGEFCQIVDGTLSFGAGCDDPIKEANAICNHCEESQVCDNPSDPCRPNKNNPTKATAGTLDDISNISACEGCDCLPPPTASSCGSGACDTYVFSSCRFVYDKTQAPAGFGSGSRGTSCAGNQPPTSPTGVPATGGNIGAGGNSTAGPAGGNGVCKDRAGDVWGPNFKDPKVPSQWQNPYNTSPPSVPRQGQQSSTKFRRINNTVTPSITKRGDVYTMRLI